MLVLQRSRRAIVEAERLQTLAWARVVLREARATAGWPFISVEWLRWMQNALAWVGEPAVAVGIAWLTEVRRAYGDAAAAFVLLHEIGHTTDPRPVATTTSWDKELWADEIGGMLLASMGFGIDGAVSFLAHEGNCARCTSHPPAAYRIAAVERGYAQVCALELAAA
jgi:hypothetical protein